MLVTWIGHATVLVQTAGPQHPHRPDLVRARLAFLLHRPEAGPRPGSAVRGPAEDRPRPPQPQSLRPYGPADPEAAAGAGRAADRHQPRQRQDNCRGRQDRRPRLGRASAGLQPALRTDDAVPRSGRGDRPAQPPLDLRAGAPTATGLSGRPSPSSCRAATSSSPATPATAAAAGRRRPRSAVPSASPSSPSAPTSRATSCRPIT